MKLRLLLILLLLFALVTLIVLIIPRLGPSTEISVPQPDESATPFTSSRIEPSAEVALPQPGETPTPTALPRMEPSAEIALPQSDETAALSSLSIIDVSDNRGEYQGGSVPRFARLEITFQVQNTVAQNFQFPYDPAPPNGIDLSDPAYQGISVDALFTPDGWKTVYRQPAFYYQYFEDQVKEGFGKKREWIYPIDHFAWKVRFSPSQEGNWQYQLVAQDASGRAESAVMSFSVAPSDRRGFVRVSAADPRYFEFDDGSPFAGLGFNRGANLEDPVLMNQADFEKYQDSDIQLLRVWISSIYGSSWNPYIGGRNLYDGYIPRTGLMPINGPGIDHRIIVMRLDYETEGDIGWFDACRLQGTDDLQAVKPNTNYKIRVGYRGFNITGPRESTYPDYGLVVKLGGWHSDCYQPGTGTLVTNYGKNNSDWGTIEGKWNSGDNYYLPRLHLALENVNQGEVYVESISIREDLGNGIYGPEILDRPSMQYHLYMPQASSYAMDKLVELAEQHDLYLKLVVLEKGDELFSKIKNEGGFVDDYEPDNALAFYGVGRSANQVRWLQQAWWRYLQARWGYSPNIHSWELTNEGDPTNQNYFALADEFGKFMHCRVFGVVVGIGDGAKCAYDHPNTHLVTTSFWHSFPTDQFWANPDFPNLDYADVHAYVSTGWLRDQALEADSALYHLDYSAETRGSLDGSAKQNRVKTKPIIRGEAGIDMLDQQSENPDLAKDSQGVWLHNLLWAGLDPGALYELYWWGATIAGQPGPDGKQGLYEIYRYFADFIHDIPLNNGKYRDAAASVNNPSLRVVGQKDTLNNRAHLWVQNKRHTWRNVVDGVKDTSGVSGTVEIDGFTPEMTLKVEWNVFTTQGTPSISFSTVSVDNHGNITLNLPSDPKITDVGIKIGDY
jgi:hypothetical protein